MRHAATITCFLLAALASNYCSAAGADREPNQCRPFLKYVAPGGWDIPPSSTVRKSGTFQRAGFPSGITFTEYAVNSMPPMFLPRHCIDGESLVLLSLRYTFATVTRLEVNGMPFAFFGLARGVDAGSASLAMWVDVDGSGVFREFRWGIDEGVPEWVASRLQIGAGIPK